MKRMLKKPVSILLAVLLLTSYSGAVFAADAAGNEWETLRVGFFAFPGYHNIDEDGRRSGYGYEFLQRLAIHGGWTYEYVGYDGSYADSLDMLRNGEVDIVTSVSKTPEREKEFLFSEESIGRKSTIFTVKSGNQDIISGDYSTYEGAVVGMLTNNTMNDRFNIFAQEHGFSYTPAFFATEGALASALQEGKVDAAVSSSLRLLKNEWVLDSFDANPFYICTRKDRADLMARINQSINAMDLHSPNWRDALHEVYYSVDEAGDILLNREELTYLENLESSGKSLKVLFNPDRVPYCYFKDGKARGILPATFEALAARLGFDYEYLPCDSRMEYYDLRSSGAADIILDCTGDYYLAEQENFKITVPYYQTSFAFITLDGYSGEYSTIAALERADALDGLISERFSEIKVNRYLDVDTCVDAVRDGKADAAVFYSYTASYYVQIDERGELSSVTFGNTSFSYGVSDAVPGGRYLLSMLDKGADSFTSAELDTIATREINASRNNDITLRKFLYRNPLYGVLGAVLLMLTCFAFAMAAVRSRNQRELQRKVALATSELNDKNKAMTSALQAADAANRAKTTFLNSMSHDIRTPMNAIIGYTALSAAHLDDNERVRGYLAKITQASNHLLALINDVLDMSRIESGKVTINERPENLADILHGLRDIILSDIQAKHLELFIDTIDVSEEEIFCDKLRLNQILLNLSSNAIKFTPTGGTVTLCVTQKPSSIPGQGLYQFRVSDTGIGMSPEFAKTVFDPFTREQTSTVSGIQGTGLGMSITKNIVDLMGGSISVESEQGKGTSFIVELPLRFISERQEIGVIVELNGLRGLVVDDDMVNCQNVSKMLRQIGMRAEWTLSGREAIARTEEALDLCDPFMVYIVDWSMPGMNGVETVRGIRKLVKDDSPIILMSAYDWSEIEQEARSAGVTGFISKPLFVSDLHQALEDSLIKSKKDVSQKEESDEKDVFAGKRILLVDDNELNREIAVEILQETGFAVESAENGKLACDKFSNAEPGYYDLILMDIQMPIMDGYAATRAIRTMNVPAAKTIPIIAMTANAFEEDRKLALESGMNGHLAKPIDVDKMMSLLREILGK